MEFYLLVPALPDISNAISCKYTRYLIHMLCLMPYLLMCIVRYFHCSYKCTELLHSHYPTQQCITKYFSWSQRARHSPCTMSNTGIYWCLHYWYSSALEIEVSLSISSPSTLQLPFRDKSLKTVISGPLIEQKNDTLLAESVWLKLMILNAIV